MLRLHTRKNVFIIVYVQSFGFRKKNQYGTYIAINEFTILYMDKCEAKQKNE